MKTRQDEQVRQAFEWISDEPYGAPCDRFPADPQIIECPGDYRSPAVQLAWEAWCEALQRNHFYAR
jgi:hypothetical protein